MAEQITSLYTTKQGTLSNAQWYEQFNMRVEVAKSVGVDFGHRVLWEYTAQSESYGQEYDQLLESEQEQVRKEAEERHLAYLMVQNSSAKHDNLRQDLQNDFTKGSDQYPENRAQALMFLDRYSKSSVTPTPTSEGTAFTQKSKAKKDSKSSKKSDKKQDFDKEAFKDRKCFHCGKKGHPRSHCPSVDSNEDSAKSS